MVGFAKLLALIQRITGIFVTGAMGSTPTVLLDVHTDLLPMEQLINRVCYWEALRWGTKLEEHLMHGVVNFSFWTETVRDRDRYPPPICYLFQALNLKAS